MSFVKNGQKLIGQARLIMLKKNIHESFFVTMRDQILIISYKSQER
jgi:hypothetical protein